MKSQRSAVVSDRGFADQIEPARGASNCERCQEYAALVRMVTYAKLRAADLKLDAVSASLQPGLDLLQDELVGCACKGMTGTP
ncbi:MAG: hypothetical protein AAFR93_02805 [Pseudomonadota bacterium]